MAADTQFWLNWWVSFATAVGTVGAVLVALFSEPIRRRFFAPTLQISLSVNPGEGTKADTKVVTHVNGQLQERVTHSRWFHVVVNNTRRQFTPAHEVRVWMLELAINDQNGWRTLWIGELPMSWKDQLVKLPSLTIGHPDEADLCCLTKGADGGARHMLQLGAALWKSPPTLQWDGGCHIRVKLQARSIEVSSNVITVEIYWDGQWDDDDVRMQPHLVVTQI
jgi:hypothetical protein